MHEAKPSARVPRVFWACLLLLPSFLACQQELAAPPVASTEVVLSERPLPAEGAVAAFTEQSLRQTLDTRLPEAVEVGDEGLARRLCDYSKARLKTFSEQELPPSLAALSKELGQRCDTEVALLTLDRMNKELRSSTGELRQQRCETARVSVGFVFAHRSEGEAVVAAREELFSLCPELREMWHEADNAQGQP
ncbi:MAG: hypothetical protein RBU37_03820 [Myxococcota bacterium]|nr:hypothetical protein [Myxococcota bacterium]